MIPYVVSLQSKQNKLMISPLYDTKLQCTAYFKTHDKIMEHCFAYNGAYIKYNVLIAPPSTVNDIMIKLMETHLLFSKRLPSICFQSN